MASGEGQGSSRASARWLQKWFCFWLRFEKREQKEERKIEFRISNLLPDNDGKARRRFDAAVQVKLRARHVGGEGEGN